MSARQWFRFENKADDPSVVDIHILDVIGSWDDDWIARNWGYDMGVTARQFIEDLAKLPDTVKNLRVHINSPGGDVQGGINIANALREQQVSKGRSVETYIDGMAASIASVIAMAGSKVHMADNALFMVHNPRGGTVGDAREMRKVADILDAMRGQIVNTYRWHSSLESADLEALMDAETWMDADEALAKGFITDKVEGLQAAALFDPKAVASFKVPDKFKARVDGFLKQMPTAPKAAAATEVLRLCTDGGCLELAEDLIKQNATTDQVQTKVAAAKQQKAAASVRATEITALCQTAKLPELAAGYIAGNMNLADIRNHLTTLRAKFDRIEIDGTLKPDQGAEAITASWKDAHARVSGKRK